MDLVDLALEHLDMDMEDLRQAQTLHDTINALEALQNTVKTYGFSNALLSFADFDLSLSGAISEIPSPESYLSDSTADVSAATEAVASKIKATASRWYAAMKAHVVKYRKFYIAGAATIAATIVAVSAYSRYMKGKEPKPKWQDDFKRKREEIIAELRKQNFKTGTSMGHYKEGPGVYPSQQWSHPDSRNQKFKREYMEETENLIRQLETGVPPAGLMEYITEELKDEEKNFADTKLEMEHATLKLNTPMNAAQRAEFMYNMNGYKRDMVVGLRRVKFLKTIAANLQHLVHEPEKK